MAGVKECKGAEIPPHLQAHGWSATVLQTSWKTRDSWVRGKGKFYYLERWQKPECQPLPWLSELKFPQDHTKRTSRWLRLQQVVGCVTREKLQI